MLAQNYQFTSSVHGSIRHATLVAEVEIERIPANQFEFAAEHGGDFIEILEDSVAD